MAKLNRCRALGVSALLILVATPSWAVQTHGGAEGLVSHQVGHFLFVIGMIYLLVRIHSMKLQGRGWIEFRLFLWLILFWNLITFSGHWINEYIDADKFNRINGAVASFKLESFVDVVYYLSRLDHLVLVPAFICLLLSLRKWGHAQ